MKTIVLACGSGIATSTAVAKKVSDLLDENGYAGQYKIVQCAIAEAKANCEKGADLLIATTRLWRANVWCCAAVRMAGGCCGEAALGVSGVREYRGPHSNSVRYDNRAYEEDVFLRQNKKC